MFMLGDIKYVFFFTFALESVFLCGVFCFCFCSMVLDFLYPRSCIARK